MPSGSTCVSLAPTAITVECNQQNALTASDIASVLDSFLTKGFKNKGYKIMDVLVFGSQLNRRRLMLYNSTFECTGRACFLTTSDMKSALTVQKLQAKLLNNIASFQAALDVMMGPGSNATCTVEEIYIIPFYGLPVVIKPPVKTSAPSLPPPSFSPTISAVPTLAIIPTISPAPFTIAPSHSLPSYTPTITASPFVPCGTSQITGWMLVDSELNTNIMPMTNGAVLDFLNLPTRSVHVNIAFTDCGNVHSVQTTYNNAGLTVTKCDEDYPYAETLHLFKNQGAASSVVLNDTPGAVNPNPIKKKKGKNKRKKKGKKRARELFQSPHNKGKIPQTSPQVSPLQSLVAVLNSGTTCNGQQVQKGTISFDVYNSVTCGGRVGSFVVFDTVTKTRLFQVNDGDTICMPSMSTIEARTIRSIGQGCVITQVMAKLSGPMKWNRIASGKPPFLINGPTSVPATWPNGKYKIKAVSIGRNPNVKGEVSSISFTNQCP